MTDYNIILLGDAGVGKTALCFQYVLGQFVDDYDATIFDKYTHSITVDGKTSDVQVHDTAGQGDYTSFIPGWIRNGHAYLLVFSLTDRHGFDMLVETFIPQIKQVRESSDIPVVLVGNKYDLVNGAGQHRCREVDTKLAEQLAADLGCSYIETSAKTQIRLSNVFERAVQQARIYHPIEEEEEIIKKSKCCIL